MKVVKKCDGRSEHNVLDESTDYYLCGERQGMHPYLLAKKDYEPVQEWVDVTAQCTIETDCHGRYSLFHKNKAVFVDDCKYRVTPNGAVVYKVEVKR